MGNEIVYCRKCQTRLLAADFERGTAFKIEGIASCDKCSADVLKLLPPEKIQDFLHQMAKAKKKAPIPEPEPRVAAVPTTSRAPTNPMGLRAVAWIGMGLGAAGLIGVIVLATRASARPEPDAAQPRKTVAAPAPAPAPATLKPVTGPATAPMARFVRIELPTQILHLAEVQVYSGGDNVALKGAASQSSTQPGGEASHAIDGNTDGFFSNKSVCHTLAKHPTSWWEVDLGKSFPIERVVVWNRTDPQYRIRIKGYSVVLLDDARKLVETQKGEGIPDPSAEHVFGAKRR